MAWDTDKNHRAIMPGALVEFGEAAMGAGNTVEVPTRLMAIEAALATYKEAPAAATQIYCDCVITGGAVTFADGGVAGKDFNYMLIGK